MSSYGTLFVLSFGLLMVFLVLADTPFGQKKPEREARPAPILAGTLFKGPLRALADRNRGHINPKLNRSAAKGPGPDRKTSQKPKVVSLLKVPPQKISKKSADKKKSHSRMSINRSPARADANPPPYQLNERYRRGGVTLRLYEIKKEGGTYQLAFGVRNKEERDFFISQVMIRTPRGSVRSVLDMPYSCRQGEETAGIVHFPVHPTRGQRVSMILAESGRHYRKLRIRKIEYPF